MSASFDPEEFVAHLDEDDWDDLIDYVLDWLDANTDGDEESQLEADFQASFYGATTGGHPAGVETGRSPHGTAPLFDHEADTDFRSCAGAEWHVPATDDEGRLRVARLVFPTWTGKGHQAAADFLDACGPAAVTAMQFRDTLLVGLSKCDTAGEWTPNAPTALALVVAMNTAGTTDENGLMFGIPGAIMRYDPVARATGAHEGEDGTAAVTKPDGFLVVSLSNRTDDCERVVFDDYDELVPLMAPLLASPEGGTDRYLVRWVLDAHMDGRDVSILGVAEVLGSSSDDAMHTFYAWVHADHNHPVEITGVGLNADDLDDFED